MNLGADSGLGCGRIWAQDQSRGGAPGSPGCARSRAGKWGCGWARKAVNAPELGAALWTRPSCPAQAAPSSLKQKADVFSGSHGDCHSDVRTVTSGVTNANEIGEQLGLTCHPEPCTPLILRAPILAHPHFAQFIPHIPILAHPEPAHPVLVCWKGRNCSPRAVAPEPFPTKSPGLCVSPCSAQGGLSPTAALVLSSWVTAQVTDGTLWTLPLMPVLPVGSEGSRAGSRSSESPNFHNTITEPAKENFPDSLETKFLPLRWTAYQGLQVFLVNFSPVLGEFPAGGGVNIEERAVL